MAETKDRGTLGYEQARDELMEVVRRLESGGSTLEESLALWERGEELAQICRQWLDGARERLDAALAESEDEAEDEAEGDAEAGDEGAGEEQAAADRTG
ncbi:exodeoxyribonuclease VII small subunit [Streptomyces sp. WAC 06738]|uniref:exodeoxyribonuclease VII small subunit n=1 Tax=Streptomyces sp. WAC 06738 TaxID=2203210 RepID=UPI000F71E595|nr:exodeoxyribonuclease VII small subunit [Streptomyces sp. WAC 06738]AZM48381.1 exodeoxyribonuclease VII small subunit [Streptomyces sp. WAC 06738]